MDKPEVNNKRTVKAFYFDWRAADYPAYAQPAASLSNAKGHLLFACPGCGRFGGISCGNPKPTQSPSWNIEQGTLDDVTSLTLSPSINCVGCCGWHGYLRNGVFESC
jgi:hypothetical protein